MSAHESQKKIVVSCGDSSGDLILARIIEHIQSLEPGRYNFVGMCGPHCEAAGVKRLYDSKSVAVVGLVEVLGSLRKIFNILGAMGRELSGAQSLLCVDFPDFNLKLAQVAHKIKIPVDFVIAPQVWVWRQGRLPLMKQLIRRLYPALPFEESIFKEASIDARFLGHPLRDVLPPKNRRQARTDLGLDQESLVMAVLPGSRTSELRRNLAPMIEAWHHFEHLGKKMPESMALSRWTMVIALAPGWSESEVLSFLPARVRALFDELMSKGRVLVCSSSHKVMMAADFGWITSGTATLEAAYYGLPHILCYKLSYLSALIIRITTNYFSKDNRFAGLPNILLGREVVPELLQSRWTAWQLALETVELLSDSTRLTRMKKELRYVPQKMGEAGATERIAKDLLQLWSQASKGSHG